MSRVSPSARIVFGTVACVAAAHVTAKFAPKQYANGKALMKSLPGVILGVALLFSAKEHCAEHGKMLLGYMCAFGGYVFMPDTRDGKYF